MNTTGQFGDTRTFKLASAILLYHEGNSVVAATIHDITSSSSTPQIEPGAPITLDAVESLAQALGRRVSNCLLPENVLSVSMSRLVWWCPAARRRLWFNPDSNVKDKAELKKLNGKWAYHPALLFIAGGRNLRVLALAESKRPTEASQVYVPPYYNCDESGHVCTGSARLPDTFNATAIAKYEAAFFNSNFSHSNYGHKLTRHPGGHLGLWQEMIEAVRGPQGCGPDPREGGGSFPKKYLLPYKDKATVGTIIQSLNRK